MPQAPRSSSKKATISWLTKIQRRPVEQRAFAFILSLGLLGAMFGGITTHVELRDCMQSWSCSVINPAEQQINGIKTGGYAGIGAALMLSVPAIVREIERR